ncbi:acyl-CoA dehydrogenase family protein [Mesorhizobium sp. J428]|uniref:acyl-CoA dehydrogenase family protein n=1 Tax=Mesorhizobium sp. J428 TaxID=2898440 RepID=UPI0021512C31|nr:acyl-CoA dehydrogenase family protein [Mesorhizobium sp. J428]MCR5858565.1 acyl-CoA dehydrogenase family protein [Mesorhizobium sp. J428]
MDFDLTEEQSLIKDQLDRLLKDRYGFEERKKYMAAPEGFSPDMWSAYAEMGLMALPFAEEHGGIGGGPVETMIVMESFGRVLALEPYFATVVLGGGFLRSGASDAQKGELIPGIADGSAKYAFAQVERGARYDLAHVSTTAAKDGSGWKLSGAKSLVLHGDSADKLIVTARTGGRPGEEAGVGVFVVDAGAAGVSRRGYPTQDGLRAAEISFDNVRAEHVLGDPGSGMPLVRTVVDQAIAALAAEAVGVMSAMHELTVDYIKVRKQFGVAIGQFQVLQHKAVDMFIATEQMRSIAMFATMMADSDDAAERARAMHAAKAELGRGGKLAGENAIQLHGGVGMTMEYAVTHYFKRLTMMNTLFGDGDFHLRRLAALGGLFDKAA